MFKERDIDDLCEQDDALLPKFADTIVQAIKWTPMSTASIPVTSSYRQRYRCGRCAHYTFNPRTVSTGLGWCNVRNDVPMAVPWRLIECEQFKDD